MKNIYDKIGLTVLLMTSLSIIPIVLACESQDEVQVRTYKYLQENYMQSLLYFKDKRTNLCFVGHQIGEQSDIISYVPCTPEVENLIATKKRFAESK